jgi:uncharacterized protein YuzE
MRLSYDPKTDSLYIHLTEKPSVDSDEVADGVVLDFDHDGGVVGIDVQHASQHADIQRLDWRQWAGVLQDSPHLNEDPLTIQRTIRSEWG